MSQDRGLTSEQTLALILPTAISHGTAGYLYDTDGNRYVDLVSAWGANLIGYGHPRIAEAIARQAQRYVNLGLAGPEYVRLLELLRKTIPSAEAMHLVKNGSDACAVAVRLARHLTGRDLIMHRGYHGAQDWYMAGLKVPGVPTSHYNEIETLPNLAPETVAAMIERSRDRVAAVLIDPVAEPIASAADIKEVARIVRRAGALLIFDEVVSGFRVAAGGMQEVWGVQPDMTCLGKGMANGMPLAALTGPQAILSRVAEVNYSLTYGLEACSIVAACETIEEVVEKKVPEALARMGRYVGSRIRKIAEEHSVPVSLTGPECRPVLRVDTIAGLEQGVGHYKLIQALARNRVSTYGTLSFCAAHTEADLDCIVNALRPAIASLAPAGTRVDSSLGSMRFGGAKWA